jgi:2'-5' RNA ligase
LSVSERLSTRHRRLGVAVVFESPVSDEIDGLRRALGDPGRPRIPPHITLVPPVNVRDADLPAALLALREAAEAVGRPLALTLGPPATFLPDNPVLYLRVAGDVVGLTKLRDSVFRPPLARSLTWPWTPHVTIAERASQARIAAALAALEDYLADTTAMRVVLLEEHVGRIWRRLADAALAPAVVVGRGGLELRLARSELIDPEAAALAERLGATPGALGAPTQRGRRVASIAFTARREGAVIGVGAVWLDDGGACVAVGVDPNSRRQGVGSAVLAHLESAVLDAGWNGVVWRAVGPAKWYSARTGRSYSKATEE